MSNNQIEEACQWLIAHNKRVTVDAVQDTCRKQFDFYVGPAAIEKYLAKRVNDYIKSIEV